MMWRGSAPQAAEPRTPWSPCGGCVLHPLGRATQSQLVAMCDSNRVLIRSSRCCPWPDRFASGFWYPIQCYVTARWAMPCSRVGVCGRPIPQRAVPKPPRCRAEAALVAIWRVRATSASARHNESNQPSCADAAAWQRRCRRFHAHCVVLERQGCFLVTQ